MIKTYFGGVGNINKCGKDAISYRVSSIKHLTQEIIPRLDKYPLITKKLADYLLFKKALEIVARKEHLTREGLHKIAAIRASMNNGLTKELKAAFPKVIPVKRPKVEGSAQKIKDPNWLAGFTSGEGCFFVFTRESANFKQGMEVGLRFQITQHFRDTELLRSLIEYFGCGGYNFRSADQKLGDFIVTL